MPRYFFSILDRQVSPDDIGTECADVPAARVEAVRTCGQMVQEVADTVRDGSDWKMEVTDDRSRVLFVVRVSIEDKRDPKSNNVEKDQLMS